MAEGARCHGVVCVGLPIIMSHNNYYLQKLLTQVHKKLKFCMDHSTLIKSTETSWSSAQGQRKRSGWSGLDRTNNLEPDQLTDQLELYYFHDNHIYTYISDVIENAWHE